MQAYAANISDPTDTIAMTAGRMTIPPTHTPIPKVFPLGDAVLGSAAVAKYF